MPREVNTTQPFPDKLVKLIPTEIVGAYMVLDGIIPSEYAKVGTTLVSAVMLVLTPIYLRKLSRVTNIAQLVVTTLAFVLWVYTLGGPFKAFGIQEPWIASIALVLWTLIVPLLVPAQAASYDTAAGRG